MAVSLLGVANERSEFELRSAWNARTAREQVCMCASVLARTPPTCWFPQLHGRAIRSSANHCPSFDMVRRRSRYALVTSQPSKRIGKMSATTLESPVLNQQRESDTDGTLQLVSFQLAHEEYGIEINKVREIILVGEITQLPQTPPYVKGLINLRSMVIPVVDLRMRFELSEAEPTDDTRIVVINIAGKTIGIIVDAVNEVLRVAKKQIAPPPPTVAGLGQDYLVGLVKLNERLLILLDIEKILVEANQSESESQVTAEAS